MAESSQSVDFFALVRRLVRSLHGGQVYADGTISTTGTALTGSGTAFPDWAADGVVMVGDDVREVSARGSGTGLTLASALSANASGASYILVQIERDYVFEELLDYIRDGLNRFYNDHDWHFLNPWATIDTVASFSTGTVEVASGVATFTGTLPDWAADGELVIDGTNYQVDTRDDANTLTLEDTSLDADAGTSFILRQVWYDLPDDFGGFAYPWLTYRHGDGVGYPKVKVVNEGRLYELYQNNEDYAFRPHLAAARVKPHDATAGTRWQVGFWRPPNAFYRLNYRYRARLNRLNPTNRYPAGSQEHSRTILAAVLAEGLSDLDGSQNWDQKYERALEASKRYEAENVASDTVGYVTNREKSSDAGVEFTATYPGFITHGDHELFGV